MQVQLVALETRIHPLRPRACQAPPLWVCEPAHADTQRIHVLCQEGAAEPVHAALQEIYERSERNGIAISWEMQE
eukprot:12886235-Prorocentrum_lima.AAC.1